MNAPVQPPPQPMHWFIGFNLLIERISIMRLLSAVGAALEKRPERITLCLSSQGGAPDQAFYAYELLRAVPILTTHNIGTVQSAAMTLFLAGTRRLAVPHATFLMHRTVFTPGVGASLARDHLEGQVESVQSDDDRAMAIASERTGKSSAEVIEWFTGQRIRNTTFALDNSIVSAVEPVQMPPQAAFFQVTV